MENSKNCNAKTYCFDSLRDCDKVQCAIHHKNIVDVNIPQKYGLYKGTVFCPFYNMKEGENNGKRV